MADTEFRRYQMPTHLKVEDRLTIWLFTFTFRQLTVLLLGGGFAYIVWNQFPRWVEVLLLSLFDEETGKAVALGVQIASIILIVLTTLLLAFVRRRGRTLETWAIVWARYMAQPRCYRWRQLPDPILRGAAAPTLPSSVQAEED